MDVKATLHMIRNQHAGTERWKALNLAPGAKAKRKMAVAEKRPDDQSTWTHGSPAQTARPST